MIIRYFCGKLFAIVIVSKFPMNFPSPEPPSQKGVKGTDPSKNLNEKAEGLRITIV